MPSGCREQEDFPTEQGTIGAYLPDGQDPRLIVCKNQITKGELKQAYNALKAASLNEGKARVNQAPTRCDMKKWSLKLIPGVLNNNNNNNTLGLCNRLMSCRIRLPCLTLYPYQDST